MARTKISRSESRSRMNHCLDGAKLVGYNHEGHVCVWFGGYTFNVYDAAGDWSEIRVFTSGELAGIASKFEEERRDHARYRIESEGFHVIE